MRKDDILKMIPLSYWEEYNKSWHEFAYKDKLNETGVIIKIRKKHPFKRHNNIERNESNIYLIGDINKAGGICDDCVDFSDEDIVESYCKIELSEVE